MIARYLKEVGSRVQGLFKRPARKPKAPRAYAAADHGIDRALVSKAALRTCEALQGAGHKAYIVGGAVRDLMLGVAPKDFDVATNATPEQVKALFRRAFIIGRRFRLVHVVFGRGREHETIEVSTFRAYLDPAASEQTTGNEKELAKPARGESADKKHVVDASGRVLRDNVWGPQVEDAARRDFTINAMYYDPVSQIVVDYHGGLADVRAKLLRMIGDPDTRYREDPVRIIRVVRFAAKLGFALEPATLKPIAQTAPLLSNVPISRLFDEMIKLMQTGHALASIEQLRRFGLIGGRLGVFPVLDAALAPATPNPTREKFVCMALEDTDQRVAEGRGVVPSYMLACMLWHDVQERWSALRNAGEPPFPALQQAVDAVFEARIGDISGRGKLAADMREVWLMQPRFERRTASSAAALVAQVRFRAGYDFLRLRADCGEVSSDLADWWEDFHLGNDEEREALLQDVRASAPPRARRAPGVAATPRVPGAVPAVAEREPEVAGEGEGEGEGAAAAPRKRRRRRRRPAGGGEGAAPAA
jgi:poly(A) polymerase